MRPDVEGGYVNDPDDSGGPTNLGVTQAAYDEYRARRGLPRVSVKYITPDQAKQFYFDAYWTPLKPDLMIPELAIAAFDFGVNSGPHRAIRKLQATLGLKDDGFIGPMTKAALQKATLEDVTNYLFTRLRFVRLIGVKKKKYLKGWQNRVFNLANYLGLGDELRSKDARK